MKDILNPEWKTCRATICCAQTQEHFDCHIKCGKKEVGQLLPHGIITVSGESPLSGRGGDYRYLKEIKFTLTPQTTCRSDPSPQEDVKADWLDCNNVKWVRARSNWDTGIGQIEQKLALARKKHQRKEVARISVDLDRARKMQQAEKSLPPLCK